MLSREGSRADRDDVTPNVLSSERTRVRGVSCLCVPRLWRDAQGTGGLRGLGPFPGTFFPLDALFPLEHWRYFSPWMLLSLGLELCVRNTPSKENDQKYEVHTLVPKSDDTSRI